MTDRPAAPNRQDSPKPTAFRPLPNKTVVERIICRLLTAVVNKDLVPGQKIPSEMELCESMQVGRNSIREAIKVLVAMGMLNIRRSEGTFVSKGFSERMLNPMVYGLLLEDGDTATVVELYKVIAAGILQVALVKRTDEDVAALRAGVDLLADAVRADSGEESVGGAVNNLQMILSGIVRNSLVDKISVMVGGRMTQPIRDAAIRRLDQTGALGRLVSCYEEIVRVVNDRDFSGATRAIGNLLDLYAVA